MAYQFTQTGAEIQDILDLAQLQIAAPYDSASSYIAGDYCTKDDGFYVCTASTSGTWDASKWSAVTVGDVLETANAEISAIKTALTPAVTAWTKASTSQIGSSTGGNFYQIGKICLFFGTIYISNASANANYTAVNNAPAPAEAWGFSGQGGYASGATASYVLIINGNTMSIRPKVAISSEQGLYVSGAYVTA